MSLFYETSYPREIEPRSPKIPKDARCIECHENPISIKMRKLCQFCYAELLIKIRKIRKVLNVPPEQMREGVPRNTPNKIGRPKKDMSGRFCSDPNCQDPQTTNLRRGTNYQTWYRYKGGENLWQCSKCKSRSRRPRTGRPKGRPIKQDMSQRRCSDPNCPHPERTTTYSNGKYSHWFKLGDDGSSFMCFTCYQRTRYQLKRQNSKGL